MLMIPVEDIRNRDWSPVYGTVIHVKHDGDRVILKFRNGQVITQPQGTEIQVQQGGR